MRIPIASNKDPMLLQLVLKAGNQATPLRIRVADGYKPNASYTDRSGSLKANETRTFYVHMPRTAKTIVADIFNPASKNPALDNSVQLVSKAVLPLRLFPGEYNTSPLLREAVKFIQKFSERAGILSAGPSGSVYISDCGRFRIDYLDVIIDLQPTIEMGGKEVPNPMYNKELTTPARISQDRGIIEVSKKYFIQYAIPHRVAILLHEVNHFYFNTEQDDEEEADRRAVKIFLGLGYGPIDAENAFLNVFDNSPNDMNKARHEKLHAMVLDFLKRNNPYPT